MSENFVVALVGDACDGKKALFDRIMCNGFIDDSCDDALTGLIELKEKQIMLELHCLHTPEQILPNCSAVMFVFDLSDLSSFRNMRNWVPKIRSNYLRDNYNITFALVGNKRDTQLSNVYKGLAAELQMRYYEVSSVPEVNDQLLATICLLYDDFIDVKNIGSPLRMMPKSIADSFSDFGRLRLGVSKSYSRRAVDKLCAPEDEGLDIDVDKLEPFSPQAIRFVRTDSLKDKSTLTGEVKSVKFESQKERIKSFSADTFASREYIKTYTNDIFSLFDAPPYPQWINLKHRLDTFLAIVPYRHVVSVTGDKILHLAIRTAYECIEDLFVFLKGKYSEKEEFDRIIQLPNNSGNNALHIAVARKNTAALELLLQERAATLLAQHKNKDGYMPVHLIAIYGNKTSLDLFFWYKRGRMQRLFAKEEILETFRVLATSFHNDDLLHILLSHIREKYIPNSPKCRKRPDSLQEQFLDILANPRGINDLIHFVNHNEQVLSLPFDAYSDLGGSILHVILQQCNELSISFQLAALKFLLEKKRFGAEVDNQGNTLLHVAAMQPHVELLSLFLDCCDPATLNMNGDTVYHIAACALFKDIISLLLTNERTTTEILSLRNKQGFSFLHILSCNASPPDLIAHILNDHSALLSIVSKDGETPLHTAARFNQLSTVSLYFDAQPSLLYQKDYYDSIPLFTAIRFSYLQVAQYLVEKDNSLSQSQFSVFTPSSLLTLVSRSEGHQLIKKQKHIYYGLIDFLAGRKEELEQKDEEHQASPLVVASLVGDTRAALILLSHGADVTSTTRYGDTALHYAVQTLNLKLVTHLVEHKADINAKTEADITPLSICCMQGIEKNAVEIVEFLLLSGADPAFYNIDHANTLHIAIQYEAPVSFVSALLNGVQNKEQKCEILNQLTADQDTPFSYALSLNNHEVSDLLLQQASLLNIPIQSRLHNVNNNIPYTRAKHQFLTPSSIESRDIFIPTLSSGFHCLQTEEADSPFPNQYQARQQAYIYTMVGNHPNIWPFLGYQAPSSLYYNSKEIYKSATLFDILKGGKLDLSSRIFILLKIVDSLCFLHSQSVGKPSVCHNWIHLYSIRVSSSGDVHLCEFQHARKACGKHDVLFPPLPIHFGAAPELRRYSYFSLASDVFSFGVLAWELLTGTMAYGDKPITFMNTSHNELPPISTLTKALEDMANYEKIISLIRSCWSKKSSCRPTMDKVKRDFLKWIPAQFSIAEINQRLLRTSSLWRRDFPAFLPVIENKQKANFSKGRTNPCFFHASVDGRESVIKVFQTNNHPPTILAIFKEILMLKKFVGHDLINQYIYHTYNDQEISLVIESLDQSLYDVVLSCHNQGTNITYQEVIHWSLLMVKSIGEIHRKNRTDPIIHRDVKLQNFFVRFADSPSRKIEKLCLGDFGITCHQSEIGEDKVGTPGKIAPEVGTKPYGVKVDMYSFGLALLELITSTIATVNNPIPISKLKPFLDDKLWSPVAKLCHSCLKYEPELRPSSSKATKILEALFEQQ